MGLFTVIVVTVIGTLLVCAGVTIGILTYIDKKNLRDRVEEARLKEANAYFDQLYAVEHSTSNGTADMFDDKIMEERPRLIHANHLNPADYREVKALVKVVKLLEDRLNFLETTTQPSELEDLKAAHAELAEELASLREENNG